MRRERRRPGLWAERTPGPAAAWPTSTSGDITFEHFRDGASGRDAGARPAEWGVTASAAAFAQKGARPAASDLWPGPRAGTAGAAGGRDPR